MSHPTQQEAFAALSEGQLVTLLLTCNEDDASPETCIACAAYVEEVRREKAERSRRKTSKKPA